jgi:threonine/homoserine/homoserine lactone efflux protein
VPAFELLAAFILAAAVFAYMPGPAMLYATAQTIAGGRRAGWMAALGIHLGGYAHVAAAAFGLAVLFEAAPVAYAALKLAGAAYLIWLGVRFLTGKVDAPGAPAADPGSGRPGRTPRRAFLESVTVEVLNPKTALFFVAFLPQFADPEAALPVWMQLVVLGTVVNLMFSSADVLCVLLADRIVGALRRSPAAQTITRRLGGGILLALGLNLAFSRS